jgi:hypothetical protein
MRDAALLLEMLLAARDARLLSAGVSLDRFRESLRQGGRDDPRRPDPT